MKQGFLFFLLLMLVASPVASRSYTFPDFAARAHASALIHTAAFTASIDPEALDLAVRGYYNLRNRGLIRREGLVTLIDFSRPSDSERLYVIDIDKGRVLYSGLVAHGRGSGDIFATSFSNIPGSNQSSLGFYLTDTTYDGRNGYSLVLKGLDTGINDNAETRNIVIHGADYVSWDYIQRNGRLGRSLGCPALPAESSHQVIDMIKEGSCVFIYHRQKEYAVRSAVLNPGLVLGGQSGNNPS